MASTIVYGCECGELFKVFIPKARLCEGMGIKEQYPGEWAKIDKEEQEDGEIELAKNISDFSGMNFVDSREQEEIACRCGAKLVVGDFLDTMKQQREG